MEEKLYKTISEALEIELALVNDELEYNSIPEWDSVAHMSLVANLENEFDIMLDAEEILSMSSVGIIKKIIYKQINTEE